MVMQDMIKLSSIIFLSALLLSLLFAISVFASQANYPLEITNIKPAGTGTPSIPATNRIFRAYPGIEYNIRAAVIGGVYPYQFKLSNAPVGMTIDSFTGEIIWSNPQSKSGVIVLSVIDAEGTTVSTNWTITVSTSGFLFVDSSYSGTQTGSISQPYSSIVNLVNNTGSGNVTDIVYFRGGDYSFPNGDPMYLMNDSPQNWIGYPGEIVTINTNGRKFRSYGTPPVYIDNLNWTGTVDHTIMISGGQSYHTIRRCFFDGLTSSTSNNINQGFIFTTSGSIGYGLVIQDNSFTAFTGGQAIGSLYSGYKTLIENNHTYDGGFSGPHNFCTPIGMKGWNTYYTIRGNKIIMPGNASQFEIYNRSVENGDHAEFLYNLVVKLSGGNDRALILFSNPSDVYFYRNTFVGDIRFLTDTGPHFFNNNVLIGAFTGDLTNVTTNNNLIGTTSDNIIDKNWSLTSEYEKYRYTHGWELDNSTQPPQFEILASPTNLTIRVK